MKYKSKLATMLLLVIALLATSVMGCGGQSNEKAEGLLDGIYIGKAGGYGGELQVEVIVQDGKIEDIDVLEHKESSPVFTRAMPIIADRILKEQSPVVDSVSGATFTSFAVKSATAQALADAGKDFGQITFTTGTERPEPKALDDVQTQIVIVGGGPAGLSAAIAAKQAGVEDVILIEKLDILGGNGKFNMNFYDTINSQAQREIGIEWTADDFVEMKSNANDSEERIEVWAQGNYEVDQWFRDMGIELNYAYGNTNHRAEENEYAGEIILDNLEKMVKDLNVDIRTGTKGVDIIIENDKAVGVKVENREGYYNIKADAVIIATGGFSANKGLLEKYVPGAEIVETSNQMGARGDFVEVFESHDLKLNNMESLNVFNFVIKNSRELTGGADDFLLVDEEGERFVHERSRGLGLAHIILEQPGGKAFYLYDQSGYESAFRLQKHVQLGYHTRADTLEELAEALGIEPVNLKSTVETYNRAISGEIEDPFRGSDVFDRKFAEQGPYFGVPVVSAIHMTMGGVAANEKAQILNNAIEPVEGLYAAGEVTDVSGGHNAAVVFGRIAGQEAGQFVLGN